MCDRRADDRPDCISEFVSAAWSDRIDRNREIAGADEDHVDAFHGRDRPDVGALRCLDLDRDDGPVVCGGQIFGNASRSRRPGRVRRRARLSAGSEMLSPLLAPGRRSKRAAPARLVRRCRVRPGSLPAHGRERAPSPERGGHRPHAPWSRSCRAKSGHAPSRCRGNRGRTVPSLRPPRDEEWRRRNRRGSSCRCISGGIRSCRPLFRAAWIHIRKSSPDEAISCLKYFRGAVACDLRREVAT